MIATETGYTDKHGTPIREGDTIERVRRFGPMRYVVVRHPKGREGWYLDPSGNFTAVLYIPFHLEYHPPIDWEIVTGTLEELQAINAAHYAAQQRVMG